jgi:hypothetical protein
MFALWTALKRLAASVNAIADTADAAHDELRRRLGSEEPRDATPALEEKSARKGKA